MRRNLLLIRLSVGMWVAASGAVYAASYSFANIIDSTGPLQSFSNVSVNDNGDIAFIAMRDDNAHVGIYRMAAGVQATIADTTTGPFMRVMSPVINGSGVVTFQASTDKFYLSVGIYLGSGGPLTTIAQNTGPFTSFSPVIDLNDSGMVAFVGIKGGASAKAYIGTAVAISEVPNFSGASFQGISINSNGVIAARIDGGDGPVGLYTGNGGPLTTIADTSGPLNDIFRYAINDSGEVAFSASLDSDTSNEAIVTGDGGSLTLVADASGPFATLSTPSINGKGQVAFRASLDVGGGGLFTGSDFVNDKVIAIGDALFGSTVSSVTGPTPFFGPRQLNDRGQIAFAYQLTNGVSGVALASPTGVPEPSAWLLMSLGANMGKLPRNCLRRRARHLAFGNSVAISTWRRESF